MRGIDVFSGAGGMSVGASNVGVVLLADAEAHANMNLVVAPMNSKISTLGAALAARVNPDIQLCYAPAVTYNFENYSKPCDCAISFTIKR